MRPVAAAQTCVMNCASKRRDSFTGEPNPSPSEVAPTFGTRRSWAKRSFVDLLPRRGFVGGVFRAGCGASAPGCLGRYRRLKLKERGLAFGKAAAKG
jgi:hypothetical protein